jgi:predicted phosphoadenosine phosphosulfate sulfurtransferase
MLKVRRKHRQSRNVLEAAIERVEYCFKMFDTVSVSFSGGKDSTAVLNLALDEARKRNKLPLRTIFFDEEAIHPTTIEYMDRISQRDDVALEWYCLPVRHRNACSNEQPYWYCWNPDDKDLWVRPWPKLGIATHPAFKFGMSIPELGPLLLANNECCLQGIRTQESFRRYRMIALKGNDYFIARKGGRAYGYPIYDWSSEDVWRLVQERHYDYNRTYDIFNRTKLYQDLLHQRVCPPYGEEPLRGLWIYAECWPDLWHKMLYRVRGVATAARYGNTECYSVGGKPDSMTWQDYCELQLSNYTEVEVQQKVRAQVRMGMNRHFNKTNEPIPDEEPHVLSGCCWKFLAKIAIKGDLKGRQLQMQEQGANQTMQKRGMTLEETVAKHGHEKFKRAFAAAH